MQKYLDIRIMYNFETEQVFDFKEVDSQIITVSPHSGTLIPEEFVKNLELYFPQLIADIDHYASVIYSIGYNHFSSSVNRSLLDLNRSRGDNTLTGVIKEELIDGTKLAVGYTVEERENLLLQFYDPFHFALEKRVSELNKRGKVFLLNGHSMDSFIPNTRKNVESKKRLPFGIMCMGYGTAEKYIVDRFIEVLSDIAKSELGLEGEIVGFDKPYAFVPGGDITSKLGNPKKGVSAILSEIRKDLYYNESKNKVDLEKLIKLREIFKMATLEVEKILN